MGGEFRKKGVQVALGPVVGPLGRTTTGGRNWEGEFYSFESQVPMSILTSKARPTIPIWVAQLLRPLWKVFRARV